MSSSLEQYVRDINDPPELDASDTHQNVFVEKTPYKTFENRAQVKKECSAGCVSLYKDFREQRNRERRLREDEKRKRKERKNENLDNQFRQMNADQKINTLVDRANQNLERGVNMYGGFMRIVNRDLDDALDLVNKGQDAVGNKRWFISDQTIQRLYRTRAEEHVHNWAHMGSLSQFARDLVAREQRYRDVLNANGIRQPFETPLIDRVTNHAVLNNLSFGSKLGSKGRYTSRHHTQDVYSGTSE
jgi:hypothetical protein